MSQQIAISELEKFILEYRSSSWQRLVCSCSQVGGKFVEDKAAILRRELIAFVLTNPEDIEPELLRDLFVFEAEHSVHTQAVHSELAALAVEMMERSCGHYVLEFLEGLSQTFDTQSALSGLSFTVETRNAAATRLQAIKQNLKDDDNELLNFGLEYFGDIEG